MQGTKVIGLSKMYQAIRVIMKTEVGIGDWDPRDPRPGTGTGNLKIWGRGQRSRGQRFSGNSCLCPPPTSE